MLERLQAHQGVGLTGAAETAGLATLAVQCSSCSRQASFAGVHQQQAVQPQPDQQPLQPEHGQQQRQQPTRLAMRRWSKHPRSTAVVVAKTPREGAAQLSMTGECNAHELAVAPVAKKQRIGVVEVATCAELPATWLRELPGLVERCLGLFGRHLPFYKHIGTCKVS